jgi:hypothetical protein
MSSPIQPRFGEDVYPIGRLVLSRAKWLGLSRTDLVRRLGYKNLTAGHRALTELLMTGSAPPAITAMRLADALEVDQDLIDAVLSRRRDSTTRLGRSFGRGNAFIGRRSGLISRSVGSKSRYRFLLRR